MKKRNIAVNASALTQSGALSILKQFIYYAARNKSSHFYLFVDEDVRLEAHENISFINVAVRSWARRIYWGGWGFRRYLSKNGIPVDIVISLQNTSINIPGKQVVYIHQPMPFSEIKWSFFKKDERLFFLYRNFYHYFIFLFVKLDTRFVVQTNWMKASLVNNYLVHDELIRVISPDVILPKIDKDSVFESNVGFVLLYPATPLYYKNHLLILESLRRLKFTHKIKDIRFQVTFSRGEYEKFDKKAKEYDLVDMIDYMGHLPYKKLVEAYYRCDLVLFPSLIETFGLPLAEAATLGKNIICSDLPFSRDVLGEYSGVTFVSHDDAGAWAQEIVNTYNSGELADNIDFVQNSSWADFFKMVDEWV